MSQFICQPHKTILLNTDRRFGNPAPARKAKKFPTRWLCAKAIVSNYSITSALSRPSLLLCSRERLICAERYLRHRFLTFARRSICATDFSPSPGGVFACRRAPATKNAYDKIFTSYRKRFCYLVFISLFRDQPLTHALAL